MIVWGIISGITLRGNVPQLLHRPDGKTVALVFDDGRGDFGG
jgi:peptidoglycan/xylan/chitin deacetylase (PgdA/CDA1 family)